MSRSERARDTTQGRVRVERRPLQVLALGEANTRGVALSSCVMHSEATAGWRVIHIMNMAAREYAVAMFDGGTAIFDAIQQ